jgi:CRISPR-associated exonuclease Cas4
VLDLEDSNAVPVERKRAESGEFYRSDEIQLAGYCMLLENQLDEPVQQGVIYLYETDQRMHIPITNQHRETVRETVRKIQTMTVENIPPFTDNPSKCEKCSAREYCMPAETARLEPEKARGTGWEDQV